MSVNPSFYSYYLMMLLFISIKIYIKCFHCRNKIFALNFNLFWVFRDRNKLLSVVNAYVYFLCVNSDFYAELERYVLRFKHNITLFKMQSIIHMKHSLFLVVNVT